MSMGPNQLGDFATFGFSNITKTDLEHRVLDRLGVQPRTIDYGSAGRFFFYTSYGDVAETEDMLTLKLGTARSPTMSILSAQQLIKQKAVQACTIEHSAFRGNALVACFGKRIPCFSVYQTLMALPSLYYTRTGEGILCATDIRCLLALLDSDRIQLNEDAVPMHLLFGLTVGPMTYFRNIWRLFPGWRLTWKNGTMTNTLVRDLRFADEETPSEHFGSSSPGTLHQRMSVIMKAYMDEARESGHRVGNLLSGGVDSSILQMLINEHKSSSEPPSSFSFTFETSDEREREYATHASQMLQTLHTFHTILIRDYPDLLNRAIDILSQPNLRYEGEPGKLALAEALAANSPDFNYFFAGHGADGLYGFRVVRKIALLETAQRIPGSRSVLRLLSSLLASWSPSKSAALQEVAQMLAYSNSLTRTSIPTAFLPTNLVELRTREIELLRRCFGDKALLNAFEARRALEADYLGSSSEIEKTQAIGFLTTGYGHGATASNQFFSAHRKRLVQFFLDEDVIRLAFSTDPRIRFLKGSRTKPLLKEMLKRGSLSMLSEKPKLGTTLRDDVVRWMQYGPLKEMVQAIDVPGFVSKRALFDEMLTYRDIGLMWNLLTFDLFQKRVLKSKYRWYKPLCGIADHSPAGD